MKKIMLSIVLISQSILGMQNDLGEKLKKALAVKNTAHISSLIKAGAPLETRDPNGNTPLLVATFAKNANLVNFLLNSGANSNAQNIHLQDALYWAIQLSASNIGNLLLQAKANANMQDIRGRTYLHLVTLKNDQNFAQLLLDNGALVNAQGKDGNTALHIAAKNGFIDLAQLYLERGANSTIKNTENMNPLDIANLRKDKKLIHLLRNSNDKHFLGTVQADENSGKQVDYTAALNDAIKNRYTTSIEYLLSKSNLRAMLPTLLDEAIARTDSITIRFLLSKTFWTNEILGQALTKAKELYNQETNAEKKETYKKIGQMLLSYLRIIGPLGLLSKKGLTTEALPDDVKKVIAAWLASINGNNATNNDNSR